MFLLSFITDLWTPRNVALMVLTSLVLSRVIPRSEPYIARIGFDVPPSQKNSSRAPVFRKVLHLYHWGKSPNKVSRQGKT